MITQAQKFHAELQILKESILNVLNRIEELESRNSEDLPDLNDVQINYKELFSKERWINGSNATS